MARSVLGALALLLCSQGSQALENGLGLRPAMGFNTWNRFHCDINEDLVKATAQAMIDKGLKDLGYDYVNLDDCWMSESRTPEGYLQEDPTRFPSGLKALGDFIHDFGLKFGIYSSAGYSTCQSLPASLGYETNDAQTWASWGVDYLKYDNCHTDHSPPEVRYPVMRDALNATGRPIFYSMCEWGVNNPAEWAADVGNSWRTTQDITDGWASVMYITEINARKWPYAKPGAFNDPDMLEVGNGGMNEIEYRTHMSLWNIMKSPLLIGCDLRTVDETMLAILANKEVIAVNQDPLGIQGRRIWSDRVGIVPPLAILNPCNQGDNKVTWTHDVTTGRLHVGGRQEEEKEGGNEGCLTIANASFSATASITVEACQDGVPSQTWTVSGETIKTVAAPDLCLAVVTSNSELQHVGIDVQLAICNATDPAQQWEGFATIGSQLVNNYQQQCLIPESDAPPGVDQEVWIGPLADGSLAVLLFNRGDNAATTISATWDTLGLDPTSSYDVRDLWSQITLPRAQMMQGVTVADIPPHGSAFLKVSPVSAPMLRRGVSKIACI